MDVAVTIHIGVRHWGAVGRHRWGAVGHHRRRSIIIVVIGIAVAVIVIGLAPAILAIVRLADGVADQAAGDTPDRGASHAPGRKTAYRRARGRTQHRLGA